jgi:hypothetical protein
MTGLAPQGSHGVVKILDESGRGAPQHWHDATSDDEYTPAYHL